MNRTIKFENGKVKVPDHPIILFIKGDGIGPDIWSSTKEILDGAIQRAYGNKKSIIWQEVFAGENAFDKTGNWLPEETIEQIDKYKVAIKGPLTTPVGKGIRSINVALRQRFKLYSCIRPVRYFPGVPSPVKNPENVNMVIYRENMEDLYSGIEWKENSPEAEQVRTFLKNTMGKELPKDSGIGIKPMSEKNSKKLIRSAISFALENGRKSVTMMHKGNIMKFTEGAFRDWGYELAQEEFGDRTISEKEIWEKYHGEVPQGRVVIKDRIADAMFQEVIINPSAYDVIAAPNLNGDYISDALAALVGGLGIAPGANIGDNHAIFEATHGTAPDIAGKNMANPGSLLLSGEMMLRFMGWNEAADLIVQAFEKTILEKKVTADLARELEGATLLKSSDFGKAVLENMYKEP